MDTNILEDYLNDPDIAEVVKLLEDIGYKACRGTIAELYNDLHNKYIPAALDDQYVKRYIEYVLSIKYLTIIFCHKYNLKENVFTIGSYETILTSYDIMRDINKNYLYFNISGGGTKTIYIKDLGFINYAGIQNCPDITDSSIAILMDEKGSSISFDLKDFGPKLINHYLDIMKDKLLC